MFHRETTRACLRTMCGIASMIVEKATYVCIHRYARYQVYQVPGTSDMIFFKYSLSSRPVDVLSWHLRGFCLRRAIMEAVSNDGRHVSTRYVPPRMTFFMIEQQARVQRLQQLKSKTAVDNPHHSTSTNHTPPASCVVCCNSHFPLGTTRQTKEVLFRGAFMLDEF